MPRLQVLYLPDRQLGPEEFERRFGLVLDELDGPLSDDERTDLDSFAASVGAAGVYATTRTLGCEQGDDGEVTEEFAMDEFVASMRELVDDRIREVVPAMLAQQQDADKPVATTIDYTSIDSGPFIDWLDQQMQIHGRTRWQRGLA